MDPFFFDLQDDAIVVDGDDDDYLTSLGGVSLPPAQGSAFAAYRKGSAATTASLDSSSLTMRNRRYDCSGGGANAHRRMFRYLRRVGDAAAAAAGNAVADACPEPADGDAASTQAPRPPGISRSFRHMTRERLRRERLSQGFADLRALLPPGASSKGGKNDVVGAATGYTVDLEGRKRRLRAMNEELLERQAARSSSSGMVVKVLAESEQHPSVAVDVFETVLRRLKAMDELRVTGIRSCFRDDGGMWMNVGVECEVSGCDVDKAITNGLTELEEKALGMQVPRSSRPAFISCQVVRDVPRSV